MIYFYDTCSLLNNSKEIFASKQKFIISSITINELENIKTSDKKDAETKYQARVLLRLLDKYDYLYEIATYKRRYDWILRKFSLPATNDSQIIATAYYFNKHKYKEEIIFNTNDLSCRQIARTLGLRVIYNKQENIKPYCGYHEWLPLKEEELAEFYNEYLPNNINFLDLEINEYLLIKDKKTKEIVDKYRWDGVEFKKIPFYKADSKMFGKVTPFNGDIYQQIAMDSLFNNKITMIRGAAGTGKSYLSFGYMFYLLEKGKIDKIIIFCNTVATKGSAKLGYYPGSREEKLLDSQIGNLLTSKMGDRSMVEKYINDGLLVLLPMSDIRGYDTTNMNAAVYISEAQNLDIELMRLALQRIGDDSICILDGDSDTQVDSSLYAGANNGMRRVSEVFRGQDFYGEVTLQNIHRSKIAEIAQLM